MSTKGKKIDVSMRPYQSALRKLGFRLLYADRSKDNPTVWEYVRDYPEDEVSLRVQLWSDGAHRVTYAHPNLFVPEEERAPYGHETTQPVEFGTVGQMLVAIELQRAHWLAFEKAVEQEYVRECYASDGELPTRDSIRQKRRLRVVSSSAHLDDQGEYP